MLALATGCYGLHLRIAAANQAWREEASTIVGPGPIGRPSLAIEHHPEKGLIGQFRMSRRNSMWMDANAQSGDFDRQALRRTMLEIPKDGAERVDVDSSQTLVERSVGGRRS